MKGLRFTVYRHPWQRLGRETTQGDMAGTASQEGGQDCSEVLAAAGRLHIPETRTDTVPPSSDFFANLHTCSAARYVPEIHVTAVAPNFPIATWIEARPAR
jgi:hypothetical protein